MRQKPTGDYIFVTAKKTQTTSTGIVLLDNAQILSEQQVLAVGEYVKEIGVGDLIEINFEKFAQKRQRKSKVNRNPDTPDGIEDTILSEYTEVTIPVYNMDGEEVICLSQYEIMPWRIPAELVEKPIDKSKIISPEQLLDNNKNLN